MLGKKAPSGYATVVNTNRIDIVGEQISTSEMKYGFYSVKMRYCGHLLTRGFNSSQKSTQRVNNKEVIKGLCVEPVYVVTNSKMKRMFGGVGSLGLRACNPQDPPGTSF